MPAETRHKHATVLICIAAFLLIIGTIKTALATSALTVPLKDKESIIAHGNKLLGAVLNVDESIAGKTLDLLVLLIGIYTIMHGVVMLGASGNKFGKRLSPRFLRKSFANPWTHVVINAVVGIFCIVFYSLVVYTNVNIGKDPNRIGSYEILGLGGGFLLLAGAALAFVSHNVIDLDSSLFSYENLPFLVFSLVMLILFFYECYVALVARKDDDKNAVDVAATSWNASLFFSMIAGNTIGLFVI